MQSKATTVQAYLGSLPEERRAAISAVRDVLLKSLDPVYEESMQYGMIGYSVPHSIYPKGYHVDPKKPLLFAALASQKNYMALYLMTEFDCTGKGGAKQAESFREAWAKSGKKLDMGKSCIRFRKLDDLALDVIGQAVKRVPASAFVDYYERSRAQAEAAKGTGKAKAAKR